MLDPVGSRQGTLTIGLMTRGILEVSRNRGSLRRSSSMPIIGIFDRHAAISADTGTLEQLSARHACRWPCRYRDVAQRSFLPSWNADPRTLEKVSTSCHQLTRNT